MKLFLGKRKKIPEAFLVHLNREETLKRRGTTSTLATVQHLQSLRKRSKWVEKVIRDQQAKCWISPRKGQAFGHQQPFPTYKTQSHILPAYNSPHKHNIYNKSLTNMKFTFGGGWGGSDTNKPKKKWTLYLHCRNLQLNIDENLQRCWRDLHQREDDMDAHVSKSTNKRLLHLREVCESWYNWLIPRGKIWS